jgi:hypothetical protein
VELVLGGRWVAADFEGADVSAQRQSLGLLGQPCVTHCIASTSGNCSVFLRSYWTKVFRPFLFFFLGAFVVAHRIDVHGSAEMRAATGLDAPTENVANRLRGETKERGFAIMSLCRHGVAAPTSKVRRSSEEPRLASHSRATSATTPPTTTNPLLTKTCSPPFRYHLFTNRHHFSCYQYARTTSRRGNQD